MRCQPPRVSSLIFRAALALSLLSLAPPALSLQSDTGRAKHPIKKDALFDALRIKGLTTTELVKQVEERGVDFRMTEEDERELRAAGARPVLLDAIRNNYRGAGGGGVGTGTPPAADQTSVELVFWDTIKNSNDPEDFREYLQKFPNGQFAGLARRRVAALTEPKADNNSPSDNSGSGVGTGTGGGDAASAPAAPVLAEFLDSKGNKNRVYLITIEGEKAFEIPVGHVHEGAFSVGFGGGALIFTRELVAYVPDNDEQKCNSQNHSFTVRRDQITEIKLKKLFAAHGLRLKRPGSKDQDFAFTCFGEGEGSCGEPNLDMKNFMGLLFTDFDAALQRYPSYVKP